MGITIKRYRFHLGEGIPHWSLEAVGFIVNLTTGFNGTDHLSIVYEICAIAFFLLTPDLSELLDGLNQKLSRFCAGVGIRRGDIIPTLHGQ